MGFIVNLLGKLTGAGGIVDKLNGSKTYIGGAATILGGLAGLLSGAAGMLQELAKVENLAQLLEFAKGLQHDPSFMIAAAGITAVGVGLGQVGLRHAISKTDDELKKAAGGQ